MPGSTGSGPYTCSGPCLDCLRRKAAAGDANADYALKLILFLAEYMACQMLTGDSATACDQRKTRELPQEIKDIIDNGTYTKDGDLQLEVGGIIFKIIEDDDWDRV